MTVKAITPQNTQQPAPRCEKLRQLYELLPAEGKIERPELMKLTGWSDTVLERTLSAGVRIGILDLEVRCRFPDPQPDLYARRPCGLDALSLSNALASPLDRLNHKQRAALERVDWQKRNVSHHNAYSLTELISAIRNTRQVSVGDLARELGGWSTTKLYNIREIGRKLRVLRYKGKRGCGAKSDWAIDWNAIEKLPRVADGKSALIEPQRYIDKLAGDWPKQARIDETRRQQLAAIDWRKTGLKTLYQWERAKAIVAVVGNRWEKSQRELAIALRTAEITLSKNHLPHAIRAGVVKVTPPSGNTPGSIEVLWDAIEKLAGERVKAETNGHADLNGVPPDASVEAIRVEPVKKNRGQTAIYDECCAWVHKHQQQNPACTVRKSMIAFQELHPKAKSPIDPHNMRAALAKWKKRHSL